MTTSAVEEWAVALGSWGIPDEILRQAPESPWFHDPASFAVDHTLPRDTVSNLVALEALGDGGTVLDVGCGGGRSSLALVPPAMQVTGVDGSAAMLGSFREAAARIGVAATGVEGRWPDVADLVGAADVVVCHHVLYNVADLAPFVRALTSRARRRVVVEITPQHPQSMLNEAWRHFWGLERPSQPSAELAVRALRELGLDVSSRRAERLLSAAPKSPEVAFVRRRLCLPASRDAEISAWLAAHPVPRNTEAVTIWWPGAA